MIEGCAIKVYIVVTEEYYGGDIAVFSDPQAAESYMERLIRNRDDKVDVKIIEKILL